VAPGSVVANEKIEDVTTAVLDGAAVICVSGGVLSITQVAEAGVASTLPVASRARTSKVWLPSARLLNVIGLVAGAKAAPSSRASKVAVSDAANVNCALVPLVSASGAPASVVSGAVVSGEGAGGASEPPPPQDASTSETPTQTRR
jgi:small ligand-binding sensory domain FIST